MVEPPQGGGQRSRFVFVAQGFDRLQCIKRRLVPEAIPVMMNRCSVQNFERRGRANKDRSYLV